jgi:methyltransferase (TIGR00027 family)
MREDRPSSTATLIAAATVFLARDRRLSDLVPVDAASACAQFLKSASPATAAIVDTISRPGLRWAARLAERMTVPGLPLHFIVRKRCIEDAVRAGIAGGARQVVIIGAGFDTLALRLHRVHPDVRFFEIDHPATQSPKRTALEPVPANLRFIAADLARARLADVLRSDSSYLSDSYTVFVIEGLLMYLSQAAVNAVFNALSDARRARTRVVFTLMEPAPDGRLAFHNATLLERWLLSLWREPFHSAMPRGEIDAFLDFHGYSTMSITDADALRARYLAPSRRDALTLARGELVVVAERGNQS